MLILSLKEELSQWTSSSLKESHKVGTLKMQHAIYKPGRKTQQQKAISGSKPIQKLKGDAQKQPAPKIFTLAYKC